MKIKKIWFADERIYILTDTGNEFWQPLLWYPRFLMPQMNSEIIMK